MTQYHASCGHTVNKPPHSVSGECYPCHLRDATVGFSFIGGGGYGRKKFHGQTTKEFIDNELKAAKAKGIEAVPTGTRPYAGPV